MVAGVPPVHRWLTGYPAKYRGEQTPGLNGIQITVEGGDPRINAGNAPPFFFTVVSRLVKVLGLVGVWLGFHEEIHGFRVICTLVPPQVRPNVTALF